MFLRIKSIRTLKTANLKTCSRQRPNLVSCFGLLPSCWSFPKPSNPLQMFLCANSNIKNPFNIYITIIILASFSLSHVLKVFFRCIFNLLMQFPVYRTIICITDPLCLWSSARGFSCRINLIFTAPQSLFPLMWNVKVLYAFSLSLILSLLPFNHVTLQRTMLTASKYAYYRCYFVWQTFHLSYACIITGVYCSI